MTRQERRSEKKYEKDFAAFCRIMKQYFPHFTEWLGELKDPGKFWTYETEVMLMSVIMKNICNISSMQKMTDEFLDEGCVENLCRVPGVERHEFLPHYVTINEFLSRLETVELERPRKNMIRTLLRRRKFEGARFLGKYWLVIFDATGLFHFSERHCPHCLKKVINKGTPEEKEIYYHHVPEAKLALEVETETEQTGEKQTKTFQWLTDLEVTGKNAEEFARTGRGRWQIENEGFNLQKNIRYDIQHVNSEDYNAMKCHYLLTQIADILLQLYEKGVPGLREAKKDIKKISSDLLRSFGERLTGEDILFITAHGYAKAVT